MTNLEGTSENVTVGFMVISCQLCGGDRTVALFIPHGYTLTDQDAANIRESWICDECKSQPTMVLPS